MLDSKEVENIRLQTSSHVGRILVLFVGNLRLVVEAVVAESLQLFAGRLFAFRRSVVVAKSAFTVC